MYSTHPTLQTSALLCGVQNCQKRPTNRPTNRPTKEQRDLQITGYLSYASLFCRLSAARRKLTTGILLSVGPPKAAKKKKAAKGSRTGYLSYASLSPPKGGKKKFRRQKKKGGERLADRIPVVREAFAARPRREDLGCHVLLYIIRIKQNKTKQNKYHVDV